MITVSMDLELRDMPGQLVLALQPLSEFGGNIRSVVHHRDKMTPRGMIPVQVTFEIDDGRLDELVARLEENGVVVARIGKERLLETVTVLLVGHIVHSDIRETIDVIDRTGFAEVVHLSIDMPGIDKRSSAAISISATGESELNDALTLLNEVAVQKELIMITPIDVEV